MSTTPVSEPCCSLSGGLTWLGLLVGGGGIAGSLYLSLGMGLTPCPLCYYQRSFVMAATAVLLLGLLTGARRLVCVAALALPLAAAGAAVAGLHVSLEASGKLECPAGIMDYGSAPQQSLAALGSLTLLLLLATLSSRQASGGILGAVLGLMVGAGIAYGCIVSTPPAPKRTTPYDEPLKGCRPPYVEAV
jgi:disulfide bond formation protein DsbB